VSTDLRVDRVVSNTRTSVHGVAIFVAACAEALNEADGRAYKIKFRAQLILALQFTLIRLANHGFVDLQSKPT